MIKKILLLCCVLFCGSVSAAEYTVETVPNPKTYDANNFVSNPDGILSRQAVSQINQTLQSLERDTEAEVAVVVLNSIGYEDIKDFAVRLFNTWGVGKAGADNGLLILFVLDQRAITFETGYGLEGVLPDALGSRIQNENMFSEFRKGDYDAGFISGINRIASVLRQEPIDVPKEEIDWSVAVPIAASVYILLILLSILWVNAKANAVKKDARYPHNMARYTAFKNQKSGVISIMTFVLPLALFFVALILLPAQYLLFIIPMPFMAIPANIFGNALARKMRTQPIPCDACGGVMNLLSEKEEDKYLTPAQRFEEQLGSVDYDVFKCDKCDETRVLKLDIPSQYSVCPNCGTKAFSAVEKKVTVQPTYQSTGVERTTYKCKFCGYEEHKNTQLPRRQRDNTGAIIGGMAAGSILRGGGGGGGNFGGGGSFGGGRSGGGGATGRW